MSRRSRLVRWLLAFGCRHPEGMVCEHRQFAYDLRLEGYRDGFFAGRHNMEAKWRGNPYGNGPYAGYPPPGPGPENAADVR